MEEQPTYRFRYTNIDLARYVADRKFAATLLRRKAAILVTQAETIEEEADKLEVELIEAVAVDRQ